jgi:hypothetical protein
VSSHLERRRINEQEAHERAERRFWQLQAEVAQSALAWQALGAISANLMALAALLVSIFR